MRRNFFNSRGKTRGVSAFILLEAMLATAIFVMAVLALARCVEAGLHAGVLQKEDARARRALVNWMRELEAGSQPYADNPGGVDLKGEFTGMRIRQKVVPMELVDQNNIKVDGMLDVTLEVTWKSGGNQASKGLRFYAYPMAL